MLRIKSTIHRQEGEGKDAATKKEKRRLSGERRGGGEQRERMEDLYWLNEKKWGPSSLSLDQLNSTARG